MKTMAITQNGDTSVIQPLELPLPVIGEYDLLINVLYSSVNPVDNLIRTGSIERTEFPAILGFDVCGIVKDAGDKVRAFNCGDVIAALPNLIKQGANAEYVVIDSRTATKVPDSIHPETAGVFPLVALTAWESLFDRANITKGETVLIHAGAGGIGHIAIQLAKEAGCKVITTASRADSIALCHELGADHVINYKTTDFANDVNQITNHQGCHAIFDFVNEDIFNQSMACTGVNSRVVTVKPSRLLVDCHDLLLKGITIHFEFVGAPNVYNTDLEQQAKKLGILLDKVASGRLKPVIGKRFSITDLAKAHQLQEKGDFTGKISINNDTWR